MRLVYPFARFPALPAYVLYRRADVLQALRDCDAFSLAPVMARYGAVLGSATLCESEPAWHILRSRVGPILGRRSLARISEMVLRPLVQKLISQLPSGRHTELISSLARPLPSQILCYLIGFDPAEWRTVYCAVRQMAQFGRQPLAGLRATRMLRAHLGELIECTPPRPQGPVLQAMQKTGLAPAQMADLLMLLCWAAVETTEPALGTAVQAALRTRPHGLSCERGERARSAALDALALNAPVQMTCRLTRCEVRLPGTDIPSGALVLPHLGSAALDEAADGRRPASVIFGSGLHRCIGAQLALAEVTIAVEELLRRYPHARLIGQTTGMRGEFIRGPETVWARLE